MNNFIRIAFLIMFVDGVHADIRVDHNEITYVADEKMNYSINMSEEVIQLAQGDQISISLSDHVVLRSAHRKLSFIPLIFSNSETLQNLNSMSGVYLPTIYRETSMLHFSTIMSTDSKVVNVCKVLILHELLDEKRKNDLLELLKEQKAVFETKTSYLDVRCKGKK